MLIQRIIHRLIADYCMGSRLDEYQIALKAGLQNGFRFLTCQEIASAIRGGAALPEKFVLLRHDVDSDLATARRMFGIESKLGIRSTYYFRLSTLDVEFMKKIHAMGGEASYHFEEIATFAKRNRIKDREAVLRRIPEMQREFEENFRRISSMVGYAFATVSSHGDFANRKLGVPNHRLLGDAELRLRLGIECETYDPVLLDSFDCYASDDPYPKFYRGATFLDSFANHSKICLLVHPQHWASNIVDNTRLNVLRIREALLYAL
ncbi:MAG: hypothetical protein IPN71_03695 [Fibrobacteres bacterium]|nr:hypothetical protein [Fibrobacterota bacterium]